MKKGWDLDGACIAHCNRKEAKRMSIEWVGWYYVGENKILVEGDLLVALKKPCLFCCTCSTWYGT